jgi:hypothetical protein
MIAKGQTIFQIMMIFSPFRCVYKCGTNCNEQFTNATERTIGSLFRKVSVLDRVINYNRIEVEIALKNTKRTVLVSISQKIHDTDILDVFDDGNDTTTPAHVSGDDVDGILIESTTVQTDCIDFGLRALPHEDILNCHHYNAYYMIMPRAKELVSLVDASKFPKERGVIVEDALDKMISTEKANIASVNPPLRGAIVYGCPVGKVRKTNVSSCNFNSFLFRLGWTKSDLQILV